MEVDMEKDCLMPSLEGRSIVKKVANLIHSAEIKHILTITV